VRPAILSRFDRLPRDFKVMVVVVVVVVVMRCDVASFSWS
jgi:hypothetical protein